MHVAIPLYPGYTALDAVGPYTVLAFAPGWTVTFVAAEPLHCLGQAYEHRDCHGPLLACRWLRQADVAGWPETRRRAEVTLLAAHDPGVTGHQPPAAAEGVVDPQRQGGAGFSRIGFWPLVRDDRIHFELDQPLRIDEA